MRMIKVFEKRKSVREYKMTELDAKTLEEINEIINGVPEVEGNVSIELKLLDDGENIAKKLEGVAGYNGHMIVAPYYIGVYADKNLESYKYSGYAGEWAVLNLAKMEIGTCWVSAGDADKAKELIGYATDKDLVALISVGIASNEANISSIYNPVGEGSSLVNKGYDQINTGLSQEKEAGRKAVTDFVYLKTWGAELPYEELEQRGIGEALHYMRLAPSWGNKQPWRFILDGAKIVLAVEHHDGLDDKVHSIDAGIVMLYFEVAMHSQGIRGSWKLVAEDKESYNLPENYSLVGHFSM